MTDERIQEIAEKHCEGIYSREPIEMAVEAAIREALSSQWVDVKERLPEDTGTPYKVFVLSVKAYDSGPLKGQHIENSVADWVVISHPYNWKAWMPIPELPKS